MKKPYLGVWVDHAQAYLIWIGEQGEAEVQHIEGETVESGDKENLIRAGGAGVFGGVAPHIEPSNKRHLLSRKLYDRLIKVILNAERVYVFGPGVARKELQKRLAQHKDFTGALVAVESAEKMTEPQMAAHVRVAFHLPRQGAVRP